MLDAIIVVIGVGATVAGAVLVDHYLERLERAEASRRTDLAAAAVRLGLDQAALAARAVRAMYATNSVSNDEFMRFSRALTSSKTITSLIFLRRVEDAARADYEKTLTTDPGDRLGIWQLDDAGKPVRAARRPVYYVVESAYLPGLPADSEPDYGLDLAAVQGRADAIQRATTLYQTTTTAALTFRQGDQSGVFIFDPAVDRSGHPIGLAAVAVTLDQLIAAGESASGVSGINLLVGADNASAPQSATAVAAPAPDTRQFTFDDHVWTMKILGPFPAIPAGSIRPWAVLLVAALGLALTAAAIAARRGIEKAAEASAATKRLEGMLDGLGPVALLLAPNGTVINANAAAVTTFRHAASEMVGHPFWQVVSNGDNEPTAERIHKAIESAARGEDVRFDFSIQNDDDQQVLDLWIRRKPSTGNLVVSAVDVTARYEGEQTQRLLMRELDHRMKNMLQVVQAVIRRTARSRNSVGDFERSLTGRLGAMSRAHDLLAGQRWHGADIDEIVRQETGHFSGSGAIQVSGPHLRLNPKAALSLALVIHELGTNALKYGALSSQQGRVDVNWRADRDNLGRRALVFQWAESGGPPVQPPSNRGFGSMLVERSISYELDGSATLDYRPQGLVCTISAPLRTVQFLGPEAPADRTLWGAA